MATYGCHFLSKYVVFFYKNFKWVYNLLLKYFLNLKVLSFCLTFPYNLLNIYSHNNLVYKDYIFLKAQCYVDIHFVF